MEEGILNVSEVVEIADELTRLQMGTFLLQPGGSEAR